MGSAGAHESPQQGQCSHARIVLGVLSILIPIGVKDLLAQEALAALGCLVAVAAIATPGRGIAAAIFLHLVLGCWEALYPGRH